MNLRQQEALACQCIDDLAPRLKAFGAYLHSHPELGQEEYQALSALEAFFLDEGYEIQVGLTDRKELKTAFLAQETGDEPKRRIAFLGEYDALPSLGHGCGHNLIALMSLGATLAFNRAGRPGWGASFIGCPAEETIGGKVYMSQEGLFKGYEAALIIHPGGENEVGGTSLATHPLEVTYHGRSAHVASLTDSGLNALDSAVSLYMKVRHMKDSFPKGVRIGTIFTDGGQAPNVIPDRAQLHMTVRARDVETLEELVLPAIKEAAMAIAEEEGTPVDLVHYEPLFKDMRQDNRLLDIFEEVMTEWGEKPRRLPDDEADGSTDVGNVSYDLPTVQPTLCIGRGLEAHTVDFTCAAGSDYGLDQAIKGAKILAIAALRFAQVVDQE